MGLNNILTKKKEDFPLGIPTTNEDSFAKSLDIFVLTDQARADIAARRRQRRKETEELLADLGLGPQKEWWE